LQAFARDAQETGSPRVGDVAREPLGALGVERLDRRDAELHDAIEHLLGARAARKAERELDPRQLRPRGARLGLALDRAPRTRARSRRGLLARPPTGSAPPSPSSPSTRSPAAILSTRRACSSSLGREPRRPGVGVTARKKCRASFAGVDTRGL
jgi:hypothetical protein